MVRFVFKSFLHLPKTITDISILTPSSWGSISSTYPTPRIYLPVVKKIGSLFSVPVGEAKYSTNTSNNGDGRVDTGIGGREYLLMSDEELMRQCEMSTFKASGPGGQHRNKRESAVRLKHIPTGTVAQVWFDALLDIYGPFGFWTEILFVWIFIRLWRIDPNIWIVRLLYLVCECYWLLKVFHPFQFKLYSLLFQNVWYYFTNISSI